MQTTMHPTPGLNATQAATRERQVRRWLIRIYELIQMSGCSVATAIRAIEAADKERTL